MLLDTLSLTDFRSGDGETRAAFCRNLLKAFSSHGFVTISDHDLDAEFVSQGIKHSCDLFCLPEEEKETFAHPPRPSPHRGYSYIGQENISAVSGFERGEIATKRIVDMKETFDCGAPKNTTDPNVWPSESSMPGFKNYMLKYYDVCRMLHHELMSAIAIGLDLPADTFSAIHSERTSELRLTHYPEVDAKQSNDSGKARIAEHTDFGTMTLLMQDGTGGLEVLDPATNRWYPAECAFPNLTVNIGDSMMRLMNKRIISACHRVPLKPVIIKDGVIPERFSIAYFGKPNATASLKPLDALITPESPPIFEELTGRQYELLKLGKIWDLGDSAIKA